MAQHRSAEAHVDATASAAPEAAIISTSALTKKFGRSHALDGLSLSVMPGEVHGFLGPNGSGKSTTIRILLGLMRATGGTAQVLGRDPWRDAVHIHRQLAYVPGDVSLWPQLTGGQCLDILARIHGGVNLKRRAELIERFDLDLSKRARDYSKGNRQKVSLVAAFASDAKLLILDEPTSGLDPLMEQVFQQCVRERRAAETTILLSSHILGEVEALADSVSIVRRGQIVTTGTLTHLRRHTRTHVHARTRHEPQQLAQTAGVVDLVTDRADAVTDVRFSVEPDQINEVLGCLHAATIVSLTVNPPSLDDLFLSAYANEGDEN